MTTLPRVIGLLLAWLGPAIAHANNSPHFHVLTAELQERVTHKKPAQLATNLDAIAIYRRAAGRSGGTAYLVSAPDADGYALALTNHHVAQFHKKSVKGDALLFHPGGNTTTPIAAEVVHMVSSSLTLDYALLRIRLPQVLRTLLPVRLASNWNLEEGVSVYNPSFPRMQPGEPFTPKHLQVGYADGVEYEGLTTLHLPHRDGSSGSPIFSGQTHALVGMMNAGDDEWMALGRPIGRILADLKKTAAKMSHGKVRRHIEALLRTAI